RARHDGAPPAHDEATGMRSTGYAAVWQDGGPALAGQIVVGAGELDFEGAGRGRQASRHIAPDTNPSSRPRAAPVRPTASRTRPVLELTDGAVIRISTPELGALHELEEAVTSRRKPQRDHALVDDGAVLGR